MMDACAICHRSGFGCRVAKTKNASQYPIKINLINDIGGMGNHYSYIDLIEICIDCRPVFEKYLKEFFKSIGLEPKYDDYEKTYILNQEKHHQD